MNWFRRFMMGRYGVDQLSNALLVLSILVLMVNFFLKIPILSSLAMAILLISYFRIFSKILTRDTRRI